LKAIIFDLDDTLIDSEKIYQMINQKLTLDFNFYELARSEVKKNLPKGHVSARNRILYFKKYLELQNRFSPTVLMQLIDTYENYLKELVSEDLQRSQNLETLKSLSKHYTLGIVTNENLRTQIIKLGQIDPQGDLFDFIVCSEEVGVEKPSLNIVKEAINRAKVEAPDILMVGDSIVNDLEPFSQQGCKVCGTVQFRSESTGSISPFQWITRLSELLAITGVTDGKV
jgi:HAD superfamily hydrolase (TIGR01549 family)